MAMQTWRTADGGKDLEALLDAIERTTKKDGPKVTVGEMLETVGERSFGPLLTVAGVLGMSPLSAIPGVPTTLAVIVLLIAGQLLIGRDTIWLPRFLLRRSVSADKLERAVRLLRRPLHAIDRLVKPRLAVLTTPLADRFVAAICVLLALATPPLELLPFVAFIPSTAIAFFGVGLVARDGLVILIGLALTGGAAGVTAFNLLTPSSTA
jgi:hypothetical protein